jgi:hypothetical protein
MAAFRQYILTKEAKDLYMEKEVLKTDNIICPACPRVIV